MPHWFNVLIGIVAGLAIIGGALAWAFLPQKPGRRSWLAPPTGEAGDPTPSGTQWPRDGGSGHAGF